MNSLRLIFAENILPILIVAAVGFALQRYLQFNPRTFSQLIIYALAPAIIFVSLVESDIAIADMLRMVGLALALMLCIGALSYVLSRLLRLPAKLAAIFILTTTFMNAGNFGLPFVDFTLGSEGLAWASLFFVTSATATNTVGIYIATSGTISPKEALRKLFTFPSTYAVPLALIVRAADVTIPLAIWRPIELLGHAAIPTMILLLGMQIASDGMPKRKGLVALGASVRLLVSPVVAWLLTYLFGLSSIAQHAAIIEAAMPTAVFTAVLAYEFDLDASFSSGAIFATTLLAPITLTPLVALLVA